MTKILKTQTTNGMTALTSTGQACLDLFFKIGSSRGQNIIPAFTAAYNENRELALRVAQWARDVRGGAGERQLYKDIIVHLEKVAPADAAILIKKAPIVGRWDDIFVAQTPELKAVAFSLLGEALSEKNGLAAKWTPRQGKLAAEIRKFFGMSPKFYRKSLVELTNVVESQMCNHDWDNIEFSKVPSVASARYKKAFNRNTPKFAEYVAKLTAGDKTVKVNAGAVFPYDVLKGILGTYRAGYDATEHGHIIAQWDALPNYIGDASILPVVDTSGSMTWEECAPGLQPMHVGQSLSLYCSSKNRGPFKDIILSFDTNPKFCKIEGNIVERVQKMNTIPVGGSTNFEAAIREILRVGKAGNVAPIDMPKTLLIFSDMQFNGCCREPSNSAMEMIRREYKEAGYMVPNVVFWNLNGKHDNMPVSHSAGGTALVSGFSPAIMTALLAGEDYSPMSVMLAAVGGERYAI